MPTYDYVCRKCKNRFEEVQPFSAEPVATCPSCGKAAERQFSVPVVVYKGSGFYTTDHGRSSGNGAAKKAESGEGGEKAKTEPKSEKGGSGKGDSGEKKSEAKAEAGKVAAGKPATAEK